MTDDVNRNLVLQAHEAFLTGDGKRLVHYLAEDCVLHQCGFLNPVVGAASIIELASRSERGLSDRVRTIASIISERDMVAIRCTVTGLHTGWMFVQPTGRTIAFDTMMFLRIDEGKVAEIWNIQDTASILSQLDAWPRS